jgi:hypothetical protein
MDHILEADLLDNADLHMTQPWQLNTRLCDISTGGLLERRLGVYVHWTLPQFYRIGNSAAGAASDPMSQAERQRQVSNNM